MEELLKYLIVPQGNRNVSAQPETLSEAALYLQNVTTQATPRHVDNHIRGSGSQRNVDASTFSSVPTGRIRRAKVEGDRKPTVCHFWYHYGGCRNNPDDAEYTGLGKVCRFLHHIEPGNKEYKVQNVPLQWHPKRHGAKGWSQKKKENEEDVKSTDRAPGKDEGCVETEGSTTTLVKTQLSRESEPTGALLESLGLFNNAQEEGEGSVFQMASPAIDNKRDKERSWRKRKHEDDSAVLKRPVQPPRAPRTGKGATRSKKQVKETCFFWYHGNCKRGDECELLHAMTKPPSYVQSPPGYMHYRGKCSLPWCLGGQRQEVEHGRKQSEAKCMGEELGGVIGKGMEEVESGESAEEGHRQEKWRLDGLPKGMM